MGRINFSDLFNSFDVELFFAAPVCSGYFDEGYSHGHGVDAKSHVSCHTEGLGDKRLSNMELLTCVTSSAVAEPLIFAEASRRMPVAQPSIIQTVSLPGDD